MPSFDLLCASGAWKSFDWPDGEPFSVGRDPSCTVQIDEPGVPSVFAVFGSDEAGPFARSVGAHLSVDGVLAFEQRLNDRASIPVGSCFLVFRKDGAADYSEFNEDGADTRPEVPVGEPIDLPDHIFGNLDSAPPHRSPVCETLLCVGGKSKGTVLSFPEPLGSFDLDGVSARLDFSDPELLALTVREGVVFVDKKRARAGETVFVGSASLIAFGPNLWRRALAALAA